MFRIISSSRLSLCAAALALGLVVGGCAAEAEDEVEPTETAEALAPVTPADEAPATAVDAQELGPNVVVGDGSMIMTQDASDSTSGVFGGWGGMGWGGMGWGMPVGVGWGGGLGWGGMGMGWGGGWNTSSVMVSRSVGWGGGWGGGLGMGCAGLCGMW
jgi:hypothetical protein